MSAQFTTILSGVILLIVFALAGWYLRRNRNHRERRPRSEKRNSP